MYGLNPEFEIGEECYSMYNKPIHYKCPICKGNGEFLHNGHTIWCRNCSGSGKLHNARQCVAEVCKVKVRRIIASIWSGDITFKYKVDCIDGSTVSVKNRSEANLFKTREAAEEYCIMVNTKPKED